jgi:prepilin-type N-terminal cleavage/methylation domain-containing protein
MFQKVVKSERGFGLIEALVAIALLGIIAAAFLGAIATASKAILIADERTTAESLAKSQLEYVKERDYIYDENVNDGVYVLYDVIDTSTEHPSFSIWSVVGEEEIESKMVKIMVEGAVGIPWDSKNGVPATTDVGLQKITLVIKNNGEPIITLEDFKVDR